MKSKNFIAKGINLGGWLLMEGYILGGRNIAEHIFKKKFKNVYGISELKKFEQSFRDNFITKDDFANIASLGAKVIRLPFSYRLIEKKPFRYSKKGISYLDKALSWARDYKLKIILDLHAACGSQNYDWHSDSKGDALLWRSSAYRRRNYNLWQMLADRYRKHPALYAYDVLNEPVMGNNKIGILRDFYKNLIKYIRRVDKETLIFLEGSLWAQRIEFLKNLIDDNTAVSIHTYHPLNYVYNFDRFYDYPGKMGRVLWNKKRLHESLKHYYKFSVKNKVKILVGEIGINWRGGHFGELRWLDDILSIFDEFKFDYTYWTYKAIANSVFPDGVYQYIPNSEYVCREGPLYGWETYLGKWKSARINLADFWKTKNYSPNKGIVRVLKKHFKK